MKRRFVEVASWTPTQLQLALTYGVCFDCGEPRYPVTTTDATGLVTSLSLGCGCPSDAPATTCPGDPG